jgi:hypothetical protein
VTFIDEAYFTRDGIQNDHNQHVFTVENPLRSFHHVIDSGSPSTSGPLFLVIMFFFDPMVELQSFFSKRTCLISWLMCHWFPGRWKIEVDQLPGLHAHLI